MRLYMSTTKQPRYSSQNTLSLNNMSSLGVFFATLDQVLDKPPGCETLYITTSLTDTEYTHLTRNMPRHSLVVVYQPELEGQQT